MTTTDTRAAIDAAIDALIVRRADAIAGANDDLPAERAARKAIDRAITAHVAAELARRLACAPGVGEAIFMAVEASKSVGFARGSNEDCSDALRALDAALSILRTAIAEDRDRAVVEARPTPDEARRLVDAFGAVVDRIAGFADDPPANRDHYNTQMDRLIADHKAARAALLRALGVEA